jgi:hypothetical protein
MGRLRALAAAVVTCLGADRAAGSKPLPLPPGVCEKVLSIESGGESRTYLAHVPQAYCSSPGKAEAPVMVPNLEPLPVLIAIHGFGAPLGLFTPVFGPFVGPLGFALVQPVGTGRPSSFNGEPRTTTRLNSEDVSLRGRGHFAAGSRGYER